MSHNEVKKVSSTETSQMEEGHIVDNGTKVEKDVDLKDIWKLLKLLQNEISEIKETQKRLEKANRPEGGSQPQKKIKLVETTDEGNKDYTELGKEIVAYALKNGELKTKDLQQILLDHGIERSGQSCRDWLTKIPNRVEKADLNSEVDFIFDSGDQGGRGGGRQSRILVKR